MLFLSNSTPCICKSGSNLLKYLDNMSALDFNRQKMDEGWRRPKLRLTKVSRRNCVINGQPLRQPDMDLLDLFLNET